jgi:hypothetical protein
MRTRGMLSFLVSVAVVLTLSVPTAAEIATNKLAANRLAANRLAANRLAANRLAANRLAANKVAANGHHAKLGEGGFTDVSAIEFRNGIRYTH